MSKKTPVKKSKRRLKRSARRSLAAVLMITAIAVAAVPVPENYADNGDGAMTTLTVDEPDAYTYPDSLPKTYTKDDILQVKKDSNGDYDEDINIGYIVRELGDGSYQLDWQFKFFERPVNGDYRGIICEYNDTYYQDTVTLQANIVSKYSTITQEAYEKFYTDNGSTKYELNGVAPDETNATDVFLNKYFPKEYEEYNTKYQAYIKDKDNVAAPVLSKTPNDLPDYDGDNHLDKLTYYCDSDSKLKGCTLARVSDSSQTQADGIVVEVYIPQKLSGQTPSGDFDDMGLKYVNKASIIGIGNEAFKGVFKIGYLEVPKEIAYIGVSAFENSFIKGIKLISVERICDYAFKGCTQLTDVTMGNATITVGTEAFYHSGVTQITMPAVMQTIGYGAFANCPSLKTVDFSQIINGTVDIQAYAFYDDVQLGDVNLMKSGNSGTVDIETIGTAAFAIKSGDQSGMTTFTFPTQITSASYDIDDPGSVGLGDLILAGRTKLESVVFPSDFGRSKTAKLPDNLLYNCYGLSYVEFPDDGSSSCGLASYDPDTLFQSVSNPDFYVKGPELNNVREAATPRQTTWNASTAVSDVVPYLYIKNGIEYYEVSDGDYLMCINNQGVLTSCTLKDNKTTPSKLIDLDIPAKVGNTKVTAIASDCFTDENLNNNVKSLTIADDSLSTIENGVFKGWEKLAKVTLGDSITSIGDSAFEDCTNLIDVTFHDSGAALAIGTNAFKTGSSELTFHGRIEEGYAPFDWAMDPNNIIRQGDTGNIRVCYKGVNDHLTVMYNPITEMVTLVDYPKYGQISDILNKTHADEIADGKYSSYEDMKEQQSYIKYGAGEYDNNRQAFALAWQEALSSDDPSTAKQEVYASDVYGPWVTPSNREDWETWLPQDTTSSSSSTTQTPDTGAADSGLSVVSSAFDWLFEPIVAEAADTSNVPEAYYVTYPYDAVKNYSANDPFRTPTTEEQALVSAAQDIVVPKGVESIDVYGYINNLTVDGETSKSSDKNTGNCATYLNPNARYDSDISTTVWNMYSKSTGDAIAGLFSGNYKDYSSDSEYETKKQGNDLITSVTLNSVKYLPDYAFDSCERLQKVVLGPDCADIGTAPFRGCYSLTTVEGNDYYKVDQGIVYSVNTDGSYTIEEGLAARGSQVGSSAVCLQNDPNLEKVSAIKEGAFEDCDYITTVDLSSAAGLTTIPESCFSSCDSLSIVNLPRSVNDIEANAFKDDTILSDLYIPGTEIFISARAFNENSDKKVTTKVHTPSDSSASRYVDTYYAQYKLEKVAQDAWSVVFMDANNQQIGDAVYVEDGEFLEDEDIPEMPEVDENGFHFTGWLSANNKKTSERITENSFFFAQGYYDNGMVNGMFPVDFYDQVDGSKICDTKYVTPGDVVSPPATPDHSDLGLHFEKWSSDLTQPVTSAMTVLAMYTGGDASSGTTSGSTTNTSGASSSSSKGSSSSTSGSSTSSSTSSTSTSTSTTSSGSDSTTGTYTVTVVNGSGSGTYAVGSTVVIAANTPASGMKFSTWTTDSNGVSLASVSLQATTFVMPANNVTVTANFVTDTGSSYSTSSTGGTGGSTDDGNTRVSITKPGISNKDLATANVNGSTDNFVVKISETDEATQAVSAALTNKYGSLDNILYYAMDITLWDSTGTYQITDAQAQGLTVDITIPIPDALVAYGGNNMAGAVINDNQLESLNENFTTINGVPCIRFTATHFSPYTIYVDTGNLTEGMLDVTPKTGDPIHPKWFLSLGLACLSIILFMKKDKNVKVKTA